MRVQRSWLIYAACLKSLSPPSPSFLHSLFLFSFSLSVLTFIPLFITSSVSASAAEVQGLFITHYHSPPFFSLRNGLLQIYFLSFGPARFHSRLCGTHSIPQLEGQRMLCGNRNRYPQVAYKPNSDIRPCWRQAYLHCFGCGYPGELIALIWAM